MLFSALAAGALVLALAALWQSLRAAFGVASADWVIQASRSEERQGLLEEKHALLQSLKDLEFEREVGKISDKDYRRLERSLRSRARETLKLLDRDVAPFKAEAEKLIAEHLKKQDVASPYRSADRPAEAGPSTDADRVPCASCGTANDADATFCKKCGGRVEGEDPAASSGSRNEPAAASSSEGRDETTVGGADDDAHEGDTEAEEKPS
jgi:hypothetical protein